MITLYGSKHVATDIKNKVILKVYTPLIIQKHKVMSNFNIKNVLLWGYRKKWLFIINWRCAVSESGLSVRLLDSN